MKISKKNILWESRLNEILTCFSKINLSYSLTSITIIKIGIFFKRKYPKEIEFLNLTYFFKTWDSFNIILQYYLEPFIVYLIKYSNNHISNKRQEEFILIKITSSILSTIEQCDVQFPIILFFLSQIKFEAKIWSKFIFQNFPRNVFLSFVSHFLESTTPPRCTWIAQPLNEQQYAIVIPPSSNFPN